MKNIFNQIINMISDNRIKEVVIRTLEKVSKYFWEIPSSSSGKYHPEDEICEGGLVRHTIKVALVAKEAQRHIGLSDRETDLLIAAALLHDCCKSGYPENCGHTVHEHPILAANLVREATEGDIVGEWVAKIIETHMGQWTTSKYSETVLEKPQTKLQIVLHMCDYIASRKDFAFEGDDLESFLRGVAGHYPNDERWNGLVFELFSTLSV